MEDNNDILLQQFFAEASRQEIADDGFSRRVINRLPSRVNWLVRLWTVFCVTVGIVLFVVFRGWELVAEHVATLVQPLQSVSPSTQVLLLAATLFGLLFVLVGEVAQAVRCA
jgi:hypothetical protein